MSRYLPRRRALHDGRFATLLDADGCLPCEPPDDCEVCVLFTTALAGESRADWLSRITGASVFALEEEAS